MDWSPAAITAIAAKQYPDDALTTARQLPVLELVKALQEALTNEKAEAAAVGLLWRACLTVWKSSPKRGRTDLEASDLTFITRFLVDKSAAYSVAEEGFEGLASIVEAYAETLSAETVAMIAGEWLPAAAVQRQSARSRKHAFRVIDTIATRRVADAVRGGAPFLRGFTEACEGEQDPVNVLLAFRANYSIAAACPASLVAFHASDMFDVLSAYFPVLFTPAADCPVTKKDLKVALHRGMASAAYDEHCLAFLCNKLASPAAVTKNDSIEVLTTVLERFVTYATNGNEAATSLLLPSLSELLTSLRAEVLRISALGDDGDGAMLQALLQAMCLCTQSVRHLSADHLLSALSPIVSAAASTVEAGSPSGRAYATMIHAVAAASPHVCSAIIEYLAPLLCAIADGLSPTPAQNDGAVGIAAAVIASAERCQAQGLPVPPPRDVTLASLTSLVKRFAEHRDAVDRKVSNFARCAALEALATLCALGSGNSEWFSESDAIAAYTLLARTAISVTEPLGDAAKCSAKAAANAMRVDTDRGAAAVDTIMRSEMHDRARLFALCDAMAATSQGVAVFTALRRMILARPASQSEWHSCTEAAVKLRSTKDVVEPIVFIELAVNALQLAPLLRISADVVELTLVVAELVSTLDGSSAASLISQVSDHACLTVLLAASPLGASVYAQHLGHVAAVGDLTAPSAPLVLPIKAMLIAHCSAEDRAAVAQAALRASSDAITAEELAQVVKAAAVMGDAAGKALEAKLFLRAKSDAAAASACAEVLQQPYPAVAEATGTKSWQAGYFGRCVEFMLVSRTEADVGVSTILAVSRAAPVEILEDWSADLVDAALKALKPPTDGDAAALLALLMSHDASCAIGRIISNPNIAVSVAEIGTTAPTMTARASCFQLLSEVARGLGTPSLQAVLKQPVFKKIIGQVTAMTKPALDDPKRVVRQAAASARHYWMLLETATR